MTLSDIVSSPFEGLNDQVNDYDDFKWSYGHSSRHSSSLRYMTISVVISNMLSSMQGLTSTCMSS